MSKRIVHLKYKQITFKNLNLNFARSFCKSLHITIKQDGSIFYVVPYGTPQFEIYNFLDKKYNWIIKTQTKILTNATNINNNSLSILQKKMLNDKIKNYIEKYEKILNVKVEKFNCRKMKTLWGSCSYLKKSIRFNTNLYYKSDDFVEYIVLHEMTHILVPNHSKQFYSIIEKYMPDYKKIKKQ